VVDVVGGCVHACMSAHLSHLWERNEICFSHIYTPLKNPDNAMLNIAHLDLAVLYPAYL
jgi:hypothetical protein